MPQQRWIITDWFWHFLALDIKEACDPHCPKLELMLCINALSINHDDEVLVMIDTLLMILYTVYYPLSHDI